MLIGYMRISSTTDRQTTALQQDALVAAGVDTRHLYVDHCSGARDDRPGLKKALADTQEGDVLIVWRLDRLGRSLQHLLATVTDLQARGVGFRSLCEQMDTTTAAGRLMLAIFGALAEFERELTRERIQAGLQAARRRGRIGGRPRAISDEQLTAIKAALDNGMSNAQAARTFGVKRPTLLQTLARQAR